MADLLRRLRRRRSLRFRITLSAVVVVGVTLVIAAGVFSVVQRALLDQGVSSRASTAADRVLAQLEAGAEPESAVDAARASLGDDGFVVVEAAATHAILATGGDGLAVRAYERQLDRAPGARLRLASTDYLVASSGATDRSGPQPTVTVTPFDDSSTRGGSGSGSESDDSASPAPQTTSGGGSGSGSGAGSGDDSGGADDSGGSGRSSGGSGDSGGSGGSGGSSGGSGGSGGSSGGDDSLRFLGGPLVPVPAAAADGTSSQYLVVAAYSTASADAAAGATRATLVAAIPILLLIMGVTTWLVVGRALRPVERMRRQVAGITAARLSSRVPDPGGADEVSRLASTLNEMLDRLDASAVSQRRFVSDASHELRSPLAVMRQHAEVAKSYPASLSSDRLADTVLTEGERLADLVTAMLVLAKADEGALARDVGDVDLDDIVGAEVARLRADGRLRITAARVDAARVRGDAGLLSQVVRNLADNAARHAASSVSFELSERPGGRVVLAVDDDGSGVPVDEREHIFERFVRLDEARDREAGGSGLGLAIVRGIVASHGGDVSVETSELGGARFVVELPAGS